MWRAVYWIGLMCVLAGCGKTQTELELQHRIKLLELQVQELQEKDSADQNAGPKEQGQKRESESLLALQEAPLEQQGQGNKASGQAASVREEQEELLADEEAEDQAGEEYRQALDVLLQGDSKQALGMFQEFLQVYEGHELAPNAHYGLGECHYVQQDFAKAILAFKEVSNQFPESSKVPDALLKMGYSYLNLGQDSNASFYLETLRERYPESKAAELAREKLSEISS
ncbi:MAG: tol-pal system protein YbgF [Desulfohalobiaceae bacterium]